MFENLLFENLLKDAYNRIAEIGTNAKMKSYYHRARSFGALNG
jgi:hypothetical protein